MALRGNLKDFSLPDVFQLVTFSRKSGVLRIKRADGAEGSVWFREGDVFFAQSNWHAELLGERLVRAQRITSQALGRALTLRAEEGAEGRRLGQILIEEGYITDTVLEAFVSEQIQETIFDLMRWDEGDFDFEATPEVVDEDIGLSVSIENVVMEGSRRLEEWTRIRKKIPSMDVVFKMATAPGEGTYEISLKPMEWNLLLLVDGTRSVAELAHSTNRTDFEVARIIYGLFSAGLLEFATDAEIAKLRAERDAREAKLAEIEAKRKAEDAAQTAQAQAREAALQAQAESRARSAAEAASTAPPEAAAEPKSTPAVSTELPEFLSGAVGPSPEDAAVLEEMMGAILGPSAESPTVVEPPAPEPASIPEPEAPVVPEPVAEAFFEPALEPPVEAVFEPVVMPPVDTVFEAPAESIPELVFEPVGELAPEADAPMAPAVLEPELTFVPVTGPTEPPGVAPAAAAAEPGVAAPDDTLAQIQASLAGLVETPAPVSAYASPIPPTPVEPTPVEPTPVEPLPDVQELGFEQNLMALGLGELPAELTEPAAEITVPSAAEPIAEPSLAPGWVEEAVEPLGVTPVPGVEAPEPPPAADEQALAAVQFAELADSFELTPESASTPAATPSADSTPDFSALLSALDQDLAVPGFADAAPVDTLYQSMPDASFDFDQELLREVSPPEATGGVISTDSFLEDISVGDLGFSGGLTDELSALTGAGRPSRPTASVNRIPEPAAAGDVLRRDTRVDRDTLLKIIDGVKNL